ncbi:MAG: hypothetical protein K0B11_17910 [Mariniphaga sp.]|nr:hypothetical protein [Mariniphaga sp.]
MNKTSSISSEHYYDSSMVLEPQSETSCQDYIEQHEQYDNLYGYDYSIVLMRLGIKETLMKYYILKSIDKEIDFIINNPELLELLPQLGQYIKTYFDKNSRLELDLFDEGEGWRSLFINVYSKQDWEYSNSFSEDFLKKLQSLGNDIFTKLNISIIPNEF